jgi:hypothetical protein
MCASSVILDYARNQVPLNQWTEQSYSNLRALVDLAAKFDEALEQKDCETVAKLEVFDVIEEYINSAKV